MKKNKLSALVMVVPLLLGVAACSSAETATALPPGKYEKTTRSVDSAGTETQRSSTTDVTVDRYGNKSATVKSKTTQDPKGLFNKKTTSETEETVKQR